MSDTVEVILSAIPQILSLIEKAEPIAADLINEAKTEIEALISGSPVTVTLSDVQAAVSAEQAADAALQATMPAAQPT